MEPRPYQIEAIEAIEREFQSGVYSTLLVLPTGAGKCLGEGTPVLLFDGIIRPVEEIRAGDVLMGPNSRPRRVLSTCQGREMLYRVIPVKGAPYVVNESHVLSLKLTPEGNDYPSERGSTVNLSVREYLTKSNWFRHRAKGYRVGVEFAEEELPLGLPPYLLGLWLADGATADQRITNVDPEIEAYLREFANERGLRVSRYESPPKCQSFSITAGKAGWYQNEFLQALRAFGLLGNKHIPHCYKANSRDNRRELLAGLIDGDGGLNGSGGYDVVFKLPELAEDTAFVARSLGLAAYVKPCRKGIKKSGFSSTYWRVSISGDCSVVPVRIGRKKAPTRQQKKSVLVTGITVQPIGEGDYYGFTLDGDGLFLLGDFTVTHNTQVFLWSVGRRHEHGDHRPTLIIAHREELLQQAATRAEQLLPGLTVGIERAEEHAPEGCDLVIASVQSISGRRRRLEWLTAGLLIVDEAHHQAAKSYGRVVERYLAPGSQMLGATATPHRMDRQLLVSWKEWAFQTVAYTYSLKQAISDGWLTDLRGYRVEGGADLEIVKKQGDDLNLADLAKAVDTDERNRKALRSWEEIGGQRPTIAFCVNVDHALHVAQAFCEAGYAAEAVHGEMDRETRGAIMQRFSTGESQILTNCMIVTEGFDMPAASCALMLRPTKSWSLYVQMAGRVTRTHPGKRDAVIIDVVDNCGRHSLVTAPTLLDLPSDFDLEGKSVLEADKQLQEIEERQQSASMTEALRTVRPRSFRELQRCLASIDLFANVQPATETAMGQLAWLTVPNGYRISLGEMRVARLTEDVLGHWHLTVTQRTAAGLATLQDREIGPTLEAAVRRAERGILTLWPRTMAVASRQARWREAPASEKQLAFLRKLGQPETVLALLDRGSASGLIDQLLNASRSVA